MPDIIVNTEQTIGQIKPLHGVNNGPQGYGTLVDVSHYYERAGIPSVRLHDPNWPHSWEIDIHTIFPDFSKDASDPNNYDFSRSDTYIQKILDTGAKIFFRLGESIEHTEKKYYVHPPEDFEKWAQVCVGIIKHYNQGWADGFHHGIQYWEIWNEPDVARERMWSGTYEQYYDLYRTAASMIKNLDPTLKVGGPAAASVKSDFMLGFLTMCQKENLPLDFYSWHKYTADPEDIRRNSLYIREELDRHGFHRTESIFNEWNYFDSKYFRNIFIPGNEHMRKEVFERSKGPEGGAFAAAALMLMQDCPIDLANYYDGQPSALFCGLFDYYGVPQKPYYAFEAFNQLVQYGNRVEVRMNDSMDGVYCCAAKDQQAGCAILISNFSGESTDYHVQISGLQEEHVCQMFMLDQQRNLQSEPIYLENNVISLLIPQHTVVLLKVGHLR